MCRPVRCKTCGKTTWAGCGHHIAQVRAGVPAGDWCPRDHIEPEKTANTRTWGGIVRRMLGR